MIVKNYIQNVLSLIAKFGKTISWKKKKTQTHCDA